jgi:hypothetical protein
MPERTLSEAVKRDVEAALEEIEIVGPPVDEANLSVCPHDFVRIELRGVR